MKRIEIYIVGFSLPKLVSKCYRKDLAKVLERLDLLGKCVMLRTAGDLHDGDVVEAVEPTPIERRPTLDELHSCCFVKVKNWDDLIKSGGVEKGEKGSIKEKYIWFADSGICFLSDMKKFCETTHKVLGASPGTSNGNDSFYLDGCESWTFTPEMLTYVAPEAVK